MKQVAKETSKKKTSQFYFLIYKKNLLYRFRKQTRNDEKTKDESTLSVVWQRNRFTSFSQLKRVFGVFALHTHLPHRANERTNERTTHSVSGCFDSAPRVRLHRDYFNAVSFVLALVRVSRVPCRRKERSKKKEQKRAPVRSQQALLPPSSLRHRCRFGLGRVTDRRAKTNPSRKRKKQISFYKISKMWYDLSWAKN